MLSWCAAPESNKHINIHFPLAFGMSAPAPIKFKLKTFIELFMGKLNGTYNRHRPSCQSSAKISSFPPPLTSRRLKSIQRAFNTFAHTQTASANSNWFICQKNKQTKQDVNSETTAVSHRLAAAMRFNWRMAVRRNEFNFHEFYATINLYANCFCLYVNRGKHFICYSRDAAHARGIPDAIHSTQNPFSARRESVYEMCEAVKRLMPE